MADPKNFCEMASGASGIVTGFASIPSGADNAIIRFEAGTARWAESASYLTASTGLLVSAADPPFRVGGGSGLGAFHFYPMAGAASLQAVYYTYHGIGQYL